MFGGPDGYQRKDLALVVITKRNQILLLALGNDIMGDDAVALLAARRLEYQLGKTIDVVEAPVAGFALLDLMQGYDKVLIVDSAVTECHEPGAIYEIPLADLPEDAFSSPHYAGLKDVISIAQRLQISFPTEIRILAIEVVDPFVLRESLTSQIHARVPDLVSEAERILQCWFAEVSDQAQA